MKNFLIINLLFVLFITSCTTDKQDFSTQESNDTDLIIKETENNSVNFNEKSKPKGNDIERAKSWLLTNYEFKLLETDNETEFKLILDDNSIIDLTVVLESRSIIFSGERFVSPVRMQVDTKGDFEFYDIENNNIGFSGFVYEVNNRTDDPCSAHDPNETFNQCFVREHDAFCGDWASCTLQDYAPLVVNASIAAHCGAC